MNAFERTSQKETAHNYHTLDSPLLVYSHFPDTTDIDLTAYELVSQRDPQLIDYLETSKTDGVIGTSSSSLYSILQHGILPPSEHHTLSSPVISSEFQTIDPANPREHIHLVHWINAEETRRYAEQTDDRLSTRDIEALLSNEHRLFIEEIRAAGHDTNISRHFLGRFAAAEAMRAYLANSQNPQERFLIESDFPVVLGISTDTIDPATITPANGSIIRGDMQISSNIPPQAITTVFAPETHIESLESITSTPIHSLERLRNATDLIIPDYAMRGNWRKNLRASYRASP